MYTEFNEYLVGYLPMDYWYDEGFSIARGMLAKFNQQDWAMLLSELSDKSLEYKCKLAYCIESNATEHSINTLLILCNTNNQELLDICVDSLRSFTNDDESKAAILKNSTLVNKIKNPGSNLGVATKKIYEDIKHQLNV